MSPRAVRRSAAAPAAAETCEPRRLLTAFVVTDAGDDGGGDGLTLREALRRAGRNDEADTITFAGGIDRVRIERNLGALEDDDVTVTGDGVVIDLAGVRGLTLDGGDYAFAGVLFSGARAAGRDGAALDLTGGADVTLTDVAFVGNRAEAGSSGGGRGGAVAVSGDSTLTMTGGVFNGNAAERGGGGIFAAGSAEVTLTDVDGNRNEATGADRDGGFLLAGRNADVVVTGGGYRLNRAAGDGGVFARDGREGLDRGGSLTVTDVVFSTNAAGVGAGAVDLESGADVAIVGSTFFRNTAERAGGGAIFAFSDTRLTIADTLFRRNAADGEDGPGFVGRGGAIALTGARLTATDVRFFQNSAADGGALDLLAVKRTTITGGRIAQNRAADRGGAVVIDGNADVSIDGTILNRNRVTAARDGQFAGGGGAIAVSSDIFSNQVAEVTISDARFFRNEVVAASPGDASGGGALSVSGTAGESVGDPAGPRVTVRETVFGGNRADGTGGAVRLAERGRLTIAGSVFRGNRAADGGAVAAEGAAGSGDFTPATLLIRDSAFVNGRAAAGAGGEGRGGAVYVAGFSRRFGGGIEGGAAVGLRDTVARVNRAESGGAVFVAAGASLTTRGSDLRFNDAGDRGGAVFTDGRAALREETRVRGNRADAGGGVFVGEDGVADLADVLFAGNAPGDFDGPGEIRS